MFKTFFTFIQLKATALQVVAFLMGYWLCTASYAEWKKPSEFGLQDTPALVLNNLQGQTIDLQRHQSKPVLINFWATWCEPCRDEFNELIYLQHRWGEKQIRVIAVNMAESKNKIESFFKNYQIDHQQIEVLLDPNGIAYRTWKVRFIPMTFLIHPNGRIQSVWVGEIHADNPKFTQPIEKLFQR